MDIIKALRTSGNKLLETEAKDIASWSKLKHNKRDLELFLNFNVAEIQFKKKSGEMTSVVCTSNTTLVKIMSLKRKKDKIEALRLKSKGLKSHESMSTTTWDIINNKMITMMLSSWQIMNFISITEENILILDEMMNDILKRGNREQEKKDNKK